MRKIFIILVAALLALGIAIPAYCGPIKKLGRGLSNVLTSPMELPYRMNKGASRMGWPEGYTYGFFEGITMVLGRALAGMFEVVTFPIPLPEKYEPIITDPEYFINIGTKEAGTSSAPESK